MTPFTPSLAPVIALCVPLLLLTTGLLPTAWANRNPRTMGILTSTVAALAFITAIVTAGLYALGNGGTYKVFSIDLPGDIGAFSLSSYVNAVTVIMLSLVSFVGAIVTRFSRNYLDGEPRQGQFFKWMSLTLAAILFLIASGNLIMFSLAWIATSLSLHQLLVFYGERRGAIMAAHKKFIVSRLADISLISAIILIGLNLHTLEFADLAHSASAFADSPPLGLQIAPWLIVLSAALKSAQFPFQGWLIQVMEAPTPVSALLHAGIVNAGAFLVIRMSPVMQMSDSALSGLAAIGLITLLLASLVMLAQTSIKVYLAWSTCAQMGFMLLEAGLGLYSLAMLHLVAHSLYKAHAFLSSGSGVDHFRSPKLLGGKSAVSPVYWLAALLASIGISAVIAALSGVHLDNQPQLLALGMVLAIASSQLLLQFRPNQLGGLQLLELTGISILINATYYALHALFEMLLAHSVQSPAINPVTQADYILPALVVAGFIGVFILQQLLPQRRTSAGWQALYAHFSNGLYIDVLVTRLTQSIWPAPLTHSKRI